MSFLEALNRRYATKKFDPTKKISPADLDKLLQAIQLAPTAYGLQPFKVSIITDSQIKKQLRPYSRDQSQITDCSHLLVFSIVKDLPHSYIQAHLDNVSSIRKIPREALNAYHEKIVSNLKEGDKSGKVDDWATHQVYIALGFLLFAAAESYIDACPLEGFLSEKYDEILHLNEQGLHTVILCALGYRSGEDHNASFKKVRRTLSDLIVE